MPSPRLVLFLVVDQLRSDYLTGYADLFLPPESQGNGRIQFGGFGFMEDCGASFADARHDHYPLFTGPGHAVLLTGAQPYQNGIVGNYWYDRHEKGGRRYCVEDLSPRGILVGMTRPLEKTNGISPVPLQVSTVGDELRMASGGRAKVWGLALKDRAAVLMAGRLANGAAWFNEDTGDWVSSRYYGEDLPPWLADINTAPEGGKRLVDTYTNQVWRFGFTNAAARIWMGPRDFSHSQTSTNYKHFTFTPFGNEFVLRTARRLVENEGLGEDAIPDILALNFSSNDYVGHQYGSASAEVLDITVQLDRQLGAFFTWLDERIGLAQVLIVLTSDHGVAPAPLHLRDAAHFDAEVVDDRAAEADFNRQLINWFGLREGKSKAATLVEYNLYVHTDALRSDLPAAQIHEQVAVYAEGAKHLGFYAAYTRERISRGQLPRTEVAERIMKGFHPDNSGDIVLVPRTFWVHMDPKYPYITSHGSPYSYDTSVPLLVAGPGIRRVRCLDRVSTLDIAPTLSYLLGVLPPSGCEGKILGAVMAE